MQALRRLRGFTMLEVLVTMVVIGVLAGVALTQFGNIQEKAYRATMKNDLRNFALAREIHVSETQSYPESADEIPGFGFSRNVEAIGYRNEGSLWMMIVSHQKSSTTCAYTTLDNEGAHRLYCDVDPDLVFAARSWGRTAEFDASGSLPGIAFGADAGFLEALAVPANEVAMMAWTFGDGNAASAPGVELATVKHTYQAVGEYEVSLTVAKKDGTTKTGKKPVKIKEPGNQAPTSAFTYSPTAPVPGGSVSFDATGSSDPEAKPVTYTWDFGDGTTLVDQTSPLATHTYATPGSYTAWLSVSDPAGNTGQSVQEIVVNNLPTASFSWTPEPSVEGQTVALSASASDADGQALSYTWTLPDGTTQAGATATYTPAAAGSYTVRLQVSDGLSMVTVENTLTVLDNQAPAASFSWMPLPAFEGDVVTLIASASDPEGDPLTYTWTLASGEVVSAYTFSGESAQFGPAAAGSYPVTLSVSDGWNTTEVSGAVTVLDNQAPVPNFWTTLNRPQPYLAGTPLLAVENGSYDMDGQIVSCTLDWGDGAPTESLDWTTCSSYQFIHKYLAPGTYTLTVTLVDNRGEAGTQQITVPVLANEAPLVAPLTVSPTKALDPHVQIEAGTTVCFETTASDDHLSSEQLWTRWDLGNGITGESQGNYRSCTSYHTKGFYTASLQVRDDYRHDYALLTEQSLTFEVVDKAGAPVASFSSLSDWAGYPVRAGYIFWTDGSQSYDLDGTLVSCRVNWGDGSAVTEVAEWSKCNDITHRYEVAGQYTVIATVVDNEGRTGSQTFVVDVLPNAPPVVSDITFFDINSKAAASGPFYTQTPVCYQASAVNDYPNHEIPVFDWDKGAPYSTLTDPSTQYLNNQQEVDGVSEACHVYATPGIYTISVKVRDQYDYQWAWVTEVTTTIEVVQKPNQAPVAAFSYSPLTIQEGQTITFDGSGSQDPDAGDGIANYAWDFGDWTTGNGWKVTHIFSKAGTYQVALTVTDTHGATHTLIKEVVVAPRPATFRPSGPVVGFGSFTCANNSADGYAYCWGGNGMGQLGNGTTTTSYVPVRVNTSLKFTQLAVGGSHACGISAGRVYCWGNGALGRLGTGGTANALTPVAINTTVTDFVRVTAGSSHTCAQRSGGVALCWGGNSNGQVGNNSTTTQLSPVGVYGTYAWKIGQLTAGEHHTCGIRQSDSRLLCWGWNYHYQLGNGTSTQKQVPTLATTTSQFSHLFVGQHYTCGQLSNGQLQCVGRNNGGQLGLGHTVSPVTGWTIAMGGHAFKLGEVRAGWQMHAMLGDGRVMGAGYNGEGQIGDGTTTLRSSPVVIDNGRIFQSIHSNGLIGGSQHACGLVGGDAYCWGNNYNGKLGDGTAINRFLPVPVVAP